MNNLDKFADALAKMTFGRTKSEATKKEICVMCGEPVGEFRDELSAREFQISQLCQKCQDVIFSDEEEDRIHPWDPDYDYLEE